MALATPATGIIKERLFFLDWLRIAAVVVLVLYHVGMYYVNWDFHVKSPFASASLQPWMRLTSPWRMDLLFMISGTATALLLKAGATADILKKRSRFLLLPLLCGVVLIVPPQSYFEVVQKYAFNGGFSDFLGFYLSGHKGFCNNGRCLILPTWNHLWFLPYVWCYTLFLWTVVKIKPDALKLAASYLDRWLNPAVMLLVPIALICVVRMLLSARFPSTHALFDDWFNHSIYLGMFLTGAVLATHDLVWSAAARWRWATLLLALVSWLCLIAIQPGKPWTYLLLGVQQWCAVLAALGFAKQHLNVDHPARQHLSQAVFPIYIFHQTVIIVGSQLLLPLRWSPAVEGPVLVFIALVVSYAGFVLIRQVTWLRPWFGIKS